MCSFEFTLEFDKALHYLQKKNVKLKNGFPLGIIGKSSHPLGNGIPLLNRGRLLIPPINVSKPGKPNVETPNGIRVGIGRIGGRTVVVVVVVVVVVGGATVVSGRAVVVVVLVGGAAVVVVVVGGTVVVVVLVGGTAVVVVTICIRRASQVLAISRTN